MRYILEVLFPYIVVLYLIDCIAYIRKYHLLFISHFGKGFKLKKSGLYIVGLLPIGETILSHNLPILFTSSGVYILSNKHLDENAPYQVNDFYFMPYQNIISLKADGKAIKINNKTFIKSPSSITSKMIIKLIHDLKELKPLERYKKIQTSLIEAMDLEKIKAIRADFSNSFFFLKIACSFLSANIFIILPLGLYLGFPVNIRFLLSYIGLNYLIILFVAYFMYKKIYKTEIKEKIFDILSIIMSPVSAAHVINNLIKDIFAHFDHLAIAAELLPTDAFRDLIRKEFYRIAYTKSQNTNDELIEFLNIRENTLHDLLAKTGIALKEVLTAPEKKDKSADSYCPLCGAEYISGIEKCNDCNVNLIKFE